MHAEELTPAMLWPRRWLGLRLDPPGKAASVIADCASLSETRDAAVSHRAMGVQDPFEPFEPFERAQGARPASRGRT
jgi:hypothetical protein